MKINSVGRTLNPVLKDYFGSAVSRIPSVDQALLIVAGFYLLLYVADYFNFPKRSRQRDR